MKLKATQSQMNSVQLFVHSRVNLNQCDLGKQKYSTICNEGTCTNTLLLNHQYRQGLDGMAEKRDGK